MAPVGRFRFWGAVSAFMAFMKDNQVIADDFTMTQNYIIKDISAQASNSNFDQYQQALSSIPLSEKRTNENIAVGYNRLAYTRLSMKT